MNEEDKEKILRSILFPLLFVALLWFIKLTEIGFGLNFTRFGLYPRAYEGLIGIIASPLIHGSFNHLLSNSIPLLVLGSITYYFYRPLAFTVFFWVYLMSGLWVWAAGREAYHIGASGLVYGFVTFLFFSGIFRRSKQLLVLSLLVTFLYGSLIWGIFPIYPEISWESHLLGSLAGIITAWYYRSEGPQPSKFEWEKEADDGKDNGYWKDESGNTTYPV